MCASFAVAIEAERERANEKELHRGREIIRTRRTVLLAEEKNFVGKTGWVWSTLCRWFFLFSSARVRGGEVSSIISCCCNQLGQEKKGGNEITDYVLFQ